MKAQVVDRDGNVVEEVEYRQFSDLVRAQERQLAEIDAENEINWGCDDA